MTMLLTTTSPFGIVMAADTRLTWSTGRVEDNRRKIVPWDEMRATVGFAGLANPIGGFTDEVIEHFAHQRAWATLDDFASALGPELSARIPAAVAGDARRIYVHVAGFGPPTGAQRAQFHYVRNSEWQLVLDYFQVSEDLRDTFLAKRGVLSIADLAQSDFFRVQFSGVRAVFAQRARRNLARELPHLHDLNDIVNWSKGQIRAVAADLQRAGLTPVVGQDALVYKVEPGGVYQC